MSDRPLPRASHEAILQQLRALLGDEAVALIEGIARDYREGRKEEALQRLSAYDARLGGAGQATHFLIEKNEVIPHDLYRPLSYTATYLNVSARFAIHSACAHLEELIKQRIRLMPRDVLKELKYETVPLGKLLQYRIVRKRLAPDTLEAARWLNRNVCVQAKHDFNPSRSPSWDGRRHLFTPDEAAAVYLIVRILGKRIEEEL